MKPTSRRAILYTLRELGRRAGASPEWIANWRVRFEPGWVTLFPEADSPACIRFRYDPTKTERIQRLLAIPPSHYGPADTIVFFEDEPRHALPLFRADGDTITVDGDILTSALWTLSRMEELVAVLHDEHGRFPASASVMFKARCLDRAIVDEYGLRLRDALERLFPAWRHSERPLRAKITHDIDLAGYPLKFRSTLAHVYPRRLPAAFARDLLAMAGLAEPAYLVAAFRAAQLARRRGFTSAFYWQTADASKWDAGYDLTHPVIGAAVRALLDQDCEIGLHPGYGTFESQAMLEREVRRLRHVVGNAPIGGRQHFLRWRPATWAAWERAGLAYDSSVGFADAVGFRAGTCIPYHPWLLDEDRECTVLEVPLIVMDGTLIAYMRLSPDDALKAIGSLVGRCAAVRGVFTLLWHNTSVIQRPYAGMYPRVLDMLCDAQGYDWLQDNALQGVPIDASLSGRAV